jgi:hypothetical protein
LSCFRELNKILIDKVAEVQSLVHKRERERKDDMKYESELLMTCMCSVVQKIIFVNEIHGNG